MKNSHIVDSHCHLNMMDDINVVLNRALESNVKNILSVCASRADFDLNIKIAAQYPGVFTTIGLHPHHIDEIPFENLYDLLIEYSSRNKVIAVGETGMDEEGDLCLQAKYFREHLRAASKTNLPVIIHSRKTDDPIKEEIDNAVKNFGFNPRGIFHCYTGGIDFALWAIKQGFYISASGIITFKNAGSLRDVFKEIPMDRILVETDAPWLAPVPHRGQKNEPSYIVETAKAIADIKEISFEEVTAITTENFYKLFNIRYSDIGATGFEPVTH